LSTVKSWSLYPIEERRSENFLFLEMIIENRQLSGDVLKRGEGVIWDARREKV